ncbi:sensor histidine kinase [Gemmatimonas sp.]
MLVPVPRVGRSPAADFTVLSSLVGGLLIWLVLASYALGRSQRQAVRHLQQDVAQFVAGELGAADSPAAARAMLNARPALAGLAERAGVRLGPGANATSDAVLAVVGRHRTLALVRASNTPGMGMAPGRPELLQAFVALALAATCLLGALLLVRLHRQHEETAARSDFVRVVSHELRTPLSQILMFAETLRLGRTRNETDRVYALDVILQEARRLARLVDNVLRFTRLEQGGIALHQEGVDVAAEVRDLAAQFASAGQPGTSVSVALHTASRALGDRDALRQVLVNLFDNAFKHGGASAQVTVTVSRQGERVLVCVEDNGPGIASADHERIWYPFSRGSRGVPGDTGTGLGLTIVRGLVTAMDGTVHTETGIRGVGARFVVSLRAHGAPEIAAARDTPS